MAACVLIDEASYDAAGLQDQGVAPELMDALNAVQAGFGDGGAGGINMQAAMVEETEAKGTALDQLTAEIVSIVFDHLYADRRLPDPVKQQLLRLQIVALKAALISYGAQLSKELAAENIRVNIVSPGPIYFEGGPWDFIKKGMPEAYEDALKHCVIGRLGTPEEVAAAVVFLASPVSGFTVGQNLHVDGGYMEHVAF